MAETLTESFCERCGTRYEFKAPTRLNPIRKTRGFVGGLKNYLTSQDALSDAMGDAMRSEEDNLASAQLEAFHESFNFCIDCRQYTCVNCWNDDAGRCRSCAPIPGTDDLAERLAASAVATQPIEPTFADAVADASPAAGLEAWPTSDLATPVASDATDRGAVDLWPEAEARSFENAPAASEDGHEPFATEPIVEPELDLEPEPVVAENFEPWVEPEPVAAEWEAEPVEAIAEPWPEPVTEPVAEPVAEIEPEPVAADWQAEPEAWEEPESVVAEPEPEPAWPAAEEDVIPVHAEELAEPAAAVVEEPEAVRPSLRVVAWDDDAEYALLDAVEAEAPEAEPVSAGTDLETEPQLVAAESDAWVDEPAALEAEPLEPEPVEAEAESDLIAADAQAVDEIEPVAAESEALPTLEAPAAEAAPIAEPEPEPVAAQLDGVDESPEPVVAEAEPYAADLPDEVAAASTIEEPEAVRAAEPPARPVFAPISDTILHFPTRPSQPASAAPDTDQAAAVAETPELAARRAQLDLLGLGDPGQEPIAPDRALPYRSRGAAVTPAEAARQAAMKGSFWEASAREVANAAGQVGVQSCGSCGLSLSANARFCRRCGTRQAQSA